MRCHLIIKPVTAFSAAINSLIKMSLRLKKNCADGTHFTAPLAFMLQRFSFERNRDHLRISKSKNYPVVKDGFLLI